MISNIFRITIFFFEDTSAIKKLLIFSNFPKLQPKFSKYAINIVFPRASNAVCPLTAGRSISSDVPVNNLQFLEKKSFQSYRIFLVASDVWHSWEVEKRDRINFHHNITDFLFRWKNCLGSSTQFANNSFVLEEAFSASKSSFWFCFTTLFGQKCQNMQLVRISSSVQIQNSSQSSAGIPFWRS